MLDKKQVIIHINCGIATVERKSKDVEVIIKDDDDQEVSTYEAEEEIGTEVELIASGYEWICPICEYYNKEIEAVEEVTCYECRSTFKVSDYHHTTG